MAVKLHFTWDNPKAWNKTTLSLAEDEHISLLLLFPDFVCLCLLTAKAAAVSPVTSVCFVDKLSKDERGFNAAFNIISQCSWSAAGLWRSILVCFTSQMLNKSCLPRASHRTRHWEFRHQLPNCKQGDYRKVNFSPLNFRCERFHSDMMNGMNDEYVDSSHTHISRVC